MVNVKYQCDQNIELAVKGHADFDRYGNDIVCSACSILVYALAYSIQKEDQALLESPVIQLSSGDFIIRCRPKRKYYRFIKNKFDVILCGFELLEQNYKDHVAITNCLATAENADE